MSTANKYPIFRILYYLLAIFIMSFIALAILEGWQVRKIMIHGPIYKKVTQGREIIADILPPPAYIIESYLNIVELYNESDPARIEILLLKSKKLRREFDEAHEHWKSEAIGGELADVFLKNSYLPALEFYNIRDNEFIPLLKSKASSEVKKRVLEKMKLTYEKHRAEIDKAINLAVFRNSADEAFAQSSVSRAVWFMIGLNLFFIIFFTILYVWIIKTESAKRAISAQVDELELAKEQLVNRTAQLETSNKELESFSYSVSHDLRAPLRGIDGWSLALVEDYGELLDDKAKLYLGRVRSETQRMGELIDDLLKLAQFSRAEIEWSKINISRIAETVVARLKEENLGRKINFIIQPNLEVNGDAHFLEIVLTNLLSNSCKFTGKILEAKIEFGKTQTGEKEVYFIRDNGAGFNMNSAKNLFGAFERMHKQSEFSGTGIGLAIVKRIINLHHGNIWASAVPYQGATFFFTIQEK